MVKAERIERRREQDRRRQRAYRRRHVKDLAAARRVASALMMARHREPMQVDLVAQALRSFLDENEIKRLRRALASKA
jgi:hypothetical protein